MSYELGLMAIPIILYIVLLLVTLSFYFLGAYSLYKLSKNTGMNNPWFSFVPIANFYLIGKLADRYNRNRGKKSSLGILLPVLSVVPSVIYILFTAVMGISSISYQSSSSLFFAASIIPGMLITVVLSFACTIMRIYALYLIYEDFEPSRAVPYTILTVFGLEIVSLILIRNNVPVGMAGEQYPRQPKFNEQ